MNPQIRIPFMMRLLLLLWLCFVPGVASAARPNIILIFADDLGWKDVGYQGSSLCETPTLRCAGKGRHGFLQRLMRRLATADSRTAPVCFRATTLRVITFMPLAARIVATKHNSV